MEYDRKVVTAYYTAAFGEQVENEIRRQQRRSSWY